MVISFPAIIFLFGQSGVGKTTLLEHAITSSNLISPCMVSNRAPREDDNPDQILCVSEQEYKRMHTKGLLAYHATDGVNCYGILASSFLNAIGQQFLCYGSPYSIPHSILGIRTTCVLITGDASKGLQLRGGEQARLQERLKMNDRLKKLYYEQTSFISKMDIVLYNNFEGVQKLGANFFERLMQHLSK